MVFNLVPPDTNDVPEQRLPMALGNAGIPHTGSLPLATTFARSKIQTAHVVNVRLLSLFGGLLLLWLCCRTWVPRA